jgi:hypothetical protein
MTIDFNQVLSTEQKQAILSNSIQQFAAEGYKLELNRQVAEKQEDNADNLAAIDKDIATIKGAIDIYQKELEALS